MPNYTSFPSDRDSAGKVEVEFTVPDVEGSGSLSVIALLTSTEDRVGTPADFRPHQRRWSLCSEVGVFSSQSSEPMFSTYHATPDFTGIALKENPRGLFSPALTDTLLSSFVVLRNSDLHPQLNGRVFRPIPHFQVCDRSNMEWQKS
jgi:hypothetical protein